MKSKFRKFFINFLLKLKHLSLSIKVKDELSTRDEERPERK